MKPLWIALGIGVCVTGLAFAVASQRIYAWRARRDGSRLPPYLTERWIRTRGYMLVFGGLALMVVGWVER
jgi:hypothetical protein